MTFEIAQPFVCGGSTADVTCSIYDGPKFGDCIYDSFTVSAPGKVNKKKILLCDIAIDAKGRSVYI